MIKEVLNSKKEEHMSSGKFSISSINSCLRKKYLELKGMYREEYDENTKRIFNIGNLFHRDIVKELIEKDNNGIHVVASEISIPEHQYISGRIDLIVSDGKELYIVDVKSAGNFMLNKVREGEVLESYKNQVLLYMHFTKIPRGLLLFVGKDKGEIEEFFVEYDEAKALKLVQEIECFMQNFVEKGVEPPKCDNNGMWNCKCCYPEEEKK